MNALNALLERFVHLPVNLPAVAHFEHENREHLIFKAADEAVIADMVANQALQLSGESFAELARIRRPEKSFADEFQNPLLSGWIQARQLFLRFGEEAYFPRQGTERPPPEKMMADLATPSKPQHLPHSPPCLPAIRGRRGARIQPWSIRTAPQTAPAELLLRLPIAVQSLDSALLLLVYIELDWDCIHSKQNAEEPKLSFNFPPNAGRRFRRRSRRWTVDRGERVGSSRGSRRSGCTSRARRRADRRRRA